MQYITYLICSITYMTFPQCSKVVLSLHYQKSLYQFFHLSGIVLNILCANKIQTVHLSQTMHVTVLVLSMQRDIPCCTKYLLQLLNVLYLTFSFGRQRDSGIGGSSPEQWHVKTCNKLPDWWWNSIDLTFAFLPGVL